MMTFDKIGAARDAAERFIRLADAAVERAKSDDEAYAEFDFPKASGAQYTRESGAMRRASMDLTRALAEMRKP